MSESAAKDGGVQRKRPAVLLIVAAGLALAVTLGGLGAWLGTKDDAGARPAVLGATSGDGARGDFNGDGYSDLAIGLDHEDVSTAAGTLVDAGAVSVIYGSADGLAASGSSMVLESQLWHQDSPDVEDSVEADDRFGTAVAAGDFNGDDLTDLAVAVPLEDAGKGAVQILYGAPRGLRETGNQIIRPLDLGLSEALFGGTPASLAWGNFDGDAYADLVIGAPAARVGTTATAGRIHVLHGGPRGVDRARSQRWDQSQLGALAQAEAGDRFGSSLIAGDFDGDDADDLVVGVPLEDGTDAGQTIDNAGEVNVLYGSAGTGLTAARAQNWKQFGISPLFTSTLVDGAFFGSTLAAGDFNGDSEDDLAIGVPGEWVKFASGNYHEDAGSVQVIYGVAERGLSTANPVPVSHQRWTQDVSVDGSEIEDASEPNDRLGAALVAGDFNGDGSKDLAIGVPGEDFDVGNEGAVNVIYGSTGRGLHPNEEGSDELLSQDRDGIEDAGELNDQFGISLTAWNFGNGVEDDLAVGVMFENIEGSGSPIADAGLVNVIYGDSSSGVTSSGDQAWTQASDGVPDAPEATDLFGDALAR